MTASDLYMTLAETPGLAGRVDPPTTTVTATIETTDEGFVGMGNIVTSVLPR